MVSVAGITLIANTLAVMQGNAELSIAFASALRALHRELRFETVLCKSCTTDSSNLLNGEGFDFNIILEKLSEDLNMPTLQFHDDETWRSDLIFNTKLLNVVKLTPQNDYATDMQTLDLLWTVMAEHTQIQTILLFDGHPPAGHIESLLEYCFRNKAMNTVALSAASQQKNTYYVLKVFPHPYVELRKFEANSTQFFMDHTQNLHGYTIKVLSNEIVPKVFFYKDPKSDKRRMGGFYGSLIEEYVRKRNGTLQCPCIPGTESQLIAFTAMYDFIGNYTCDVALEGSSNSNKWKISATNTYTQMFWCIMVPVEKPMPAYTYFYLIFDSGTTFVSVGIFVTVSLALILAQVLLKATVRGRGTLLIFDVQILNGVLGQGFVSRHLFQRNAHRCIYLMLAVAGLLFNTRYNSVMQSYQTQPPTEHVVRGLTDFYSNHLKILMYDDKSFEIDRIMGKYSDLVLLTKDYEGFCKRRDGLDTSYAYSVPSYKWILYREQQKFFRKPIFRLTDICITRNLPLGLTLQRNSIFKQSLNVMIGQVLQSGLLNQWNSMAFLQMVHTKRIPLVDLSIKRAFEPMKLKDLFFLMIGLCLAFAGTLICFGLELVWCHYGNPIKTV